MTQVKTVEKRARLSQIDCIKYQIMTWCFIKDKKITDTDLKWVTMLTLEGVSHLNTFCEKVSNKGERNEKNKLIGSSQAVRNSLNKCTDLNILIKEGKNKKTIYINPEMQIQTEGTIMLDFKFLCVAT